MKQLQLHSLKVKRFDDMAKTYVVEYESKQYRVHMVPEQIGKGNPGEIVCTIEKSNNSYIITQDMETLLRQHYKEGDEVMYRIEKVTSMYYFLKDEYGYSTYLDSKYKINPTITPTIKCRIKAINRKRTHVELVEKIALEKSRFSIDLQHVKSLFEDHVDCSESIASLLLSEEILGSFDAECHRWIHHVCQNSNADLGYLSKIRETCLSVLEESTLLKDCKINEREVMEERFSTLIEQIGYYLHALELVEMEYETDTMDELLNKLHSTGYVFHPKKWFYIMMCIFLIKSKDADGERFLDAMMPKVFDTLRSCDIDNWMRQPFKIVWIRLLEFFIQSLNEKQDKLATDKHALANMVQALALQYNLAGTNDEELIDSGLNLSMLYRYITRVGVLSPQDMIDVAYLTLIGAIQEEPHMIKHTSDTPRMANVIFNEARKFRPDKTTSLRYEGKDADILMDNTSIRIVPKDYFPSETHDMVPAHLELWNNIQVEQYSKPQPIAKAHLKSIRPYRSMWQDVWLRMFMSKKQKDRMEEDSKLNLDDMVGIIITKQTAAETPTFECRVVDPNNIDAKGTIRMADMVGYTSPDVGIVSFEKDDKPMILDAVVKAVNPDGTFIFEAKEIIEECCEEYYYDHMSYCSTVYCVVSSNNTVGSFYAVSEQGLSVSVRYEDDCIPREMEKGTVIKVTCIEKGNSGYIKAVFVDEAPEMQLTLADAFAALMEIYSKGNVYEADDEEDMMEDMMEKPRVKELMRIIENVAALDNDYIKAYNYLGFCKMMAHIIEDEGLASYYESKMSLIELLHEFDNNNCISQELIIKFQENNNKYFTQHSTLQHMFRKLQIISYLGLDEHNSELCGIACDTSTGDLAQLAQLVLSYNFMQSTNMLAQAMDVQEHIKELLQLQKKENPKKDYGHETFTKEFKSSIVYPADSMRPDLSRQTQKVMEEICAFLNAEGGTLYIGVDDKTHLERGIEEDLKNAAFDGSTDKYDIYVRNKINSMLCPGEDADHCIRTSFDEQAHTPVYVIEIDPCPKPVSVNVNGVPYFYERRGTSSRRVSEDYKDSFIKNRLIEVSTWRKASEEELAEADLISQQMRIAAYAAEEKAELDKTEKPLEYATGIEGIMTSQIRMHRHKDDELQPNELSTYVNIFDNNTYSVTPEMVYEGLSLGIYDEEQDGYLIVVYATGEISKIPLSELLRCDHWIEKSINNKSRIVFVCPAMPSDVLSILFHSKNNDYYRFITVDNIDHGTFNTCMSPFYSGQIDEIKECEVLKLTDTNQYRNFLDIDNDKPGADAKKTDGKKAVKAISSLRGY